MRAGLTHADLVALPKAHLHLHLEATMRPATAVELGERYGLPVPAASRRYDGLAGFVVAYETARELVRTLDEVRRIAGELAVDASSDGVVW